jgi:hypothetical protein
LRAGFGGGQGQGEQEKAGIVPNLSRAVRRGAGREVNGRANRDHLKIGVLVAPNFRGLVVNWGPVKSSRLTTGARGDQKGLART